MHSMGDATGDPTRQPFYAIQEWLPLGLNAVPRAAFNPEPRSLPSEDLGQDGWMHDQQYTYQEQSSAADFAAWSPQANEYCFQQQPFQQVGSQPSGPWSPLPIPHTSQLTPSWQRQSPAALAQSAQSGPQASSPIVSTADFAVKCPSRTIEDSQQSANHQSGSSIPTPPDESSEKVPQSRPKQTRPEESQSQSGVTKGMEKKNHRVKNRAAAKRCRDKSRQFEIDLAARERQVVEDRAYLEAAATSLRDEILGLKHQILQHGDCDCAMIQGYISKVANEVSVNNGLRSGIQ